MKQFKTESKRMLDLMINSIYTNREIFLRELLSNSSDAIDKLYYKSLTEGLSGFTRDDFAINISVDEQARTLTVSDNGIGMTKDELENNLGTIAKSGSHDFKENKTGENADIDIIGQFGVGFYSAFMVAKKVEVLSKAFGAQEAYLWSSCGTEGYTVESAEKDAVGTTITLYLKDDEGEESFGEFLREYKIRELVKKYSDYIRYPIKMVVTTYEYDDVECDCQGECTNEEHHHTPKQVKKEQTLNSMTPVWRKTKAELSDGEQEKFYKEEFYDPQDPLKVIATSAEGAVDYKALLFIPKTIPYNYYTKTYEKGLKLYTAGVMITDKCADLLPDYFNFVKGVVDSEVTLNISRETVQHNRQLKAIAASLEKKIKKELASMLENDRETYTEFFDNFGLSLKYGIYTSWGANKDVLLDLIVFKSAKTGKYVSLKEYADAVSVGQKAIYYACGKSVEAIKAQPKVDCAIEKGFDVLCLTEEVDEFCLKLLAKYNDLEFKSVENEDFTDGQVAPEIDKAVSDKILEILKGKIVEVKLSQSLKNHPVSLTSKGDLTIEMEKVLSKIPSGQGAVAEKVLEINANHKVYNKLIETVSTNEQTFESLVKVLYGQARLICGLDIDDVTELTDTIFELIG
ncbi:MAG: molecular chaperone HtpG [Clostridia bacterium]|nr:molecular chaperone HtpG [Clostridia bacterium]